MPTDMLDPDWLEGRAVMLKRKTGCEFRMADFDKLPTQVRAVLNGLPIRDYLPFAWADGCRTQADAEEWMRLHFGKSVLG